MCVSLICHELKVHVPSFVMMLSNLAQIQRTLKKITIQ